MPIKSIIAAFIVTLASQTVMAAPMMWPSADTTAQPAKSSSERGWWKRFWLGDAAPTQATAPAIATTPTPARAGQFTNPAQDNRIASTLGNANRQTTLPAANPQAPAQENTVAPQSPQDWLVSAQMAEMRRDPTEARRCLREAHARAPQDVSLLREIGHFEDRQGRLEVAEQMYRRAAAAAPNDAAVLNDLALCCARQGRLQESATLLASAIQLRPEKMLYRNNIAKVLVEIDQQDAALRHLTAAHPPAAAQYNMGQLLAARGDRDGALRCFQQAAAINPQLDAARAAIASLTPTSTAGERGVQVAAAPRQDTSLDPALLSSQSTVADSQSDTSTRDPGAPRLLPPVTQ